MARKQTTASQRQLLEAIRKLFRSIAARSRNVLAVMKRRATTRSEAVQHKMYMTDVDHGRTGFYRVLIVLTVFSTPTMPSVRPLHHPAFLQGRKALRACWPCLHFDAPAWTMLSQPGRQRVIVILLIRKIVTRRGKWSGWTCPSRSGAATPSSRAALVMRTASTKPSVSTNRCRLRPLIFLPPSYPARGRPSRWS